MLELVPHAIAALLLTSCAVDPTDLARNCESAAVRRCAGIGYPGNEYCRMMFAQGCSSNDEAAAEAHYDTHPEIAHGTNPDGTCRLIWR